MYSLKLAYFIYITLSDQIKRFPIKCNEAIFLVEISV